MSGAAPKKDPVAVEKEVQAVYMAMFPQGDPRFVPTALVWIKDCFAGRYKDHQASDARYHDLEHTLQGTLCMARLLHGRHLTDAISVSTTDLSGRAVTYRWNETLFWNVFYVKGAFLDADKAFEVITGSRTLDLRMLRKAIRGSPTCSSTTWINPRDAFDSALSLR